MLRIAFVDQETALAFARDIAMSGHPISIECEGVAVSIHGASAAWVHQDIVSMARDCGGLEIPPVRRMH